MTLHVNYGHLWDRLEEMVFRMNKQCTHTTLGINHVYVILPFMKPFSSPKRTPDIEYL